MGRLNVDDSHARSHKLRVSFICVALINALDDSPSPLRYRSTKCLLTLANVTQNEIRFAGFCS